jgi:uncharacterized protein (DUF302 family)
MKEMKAMLTQTGYGLSRRLSIPYEEALQRVKAALKEEGFGVLTEIDVKGTLREKLQADFRKYDIIGACNPPLAHRALQAEIEVGLLLPCNVVVYEEGEGSVVTAFDPQAAMGLAGNPALEEIAREAKERLERALESLEEV